MCGASLFACCRLLAMGGGCDDGCRTGGCGQVESTATRVGSGPVVVLEAEIPEDWPAGQVDHIIYTFEAISPDDGAFVVRAAGDG